MINTVYNFYEGTEESRVKKIYVIFDVIMIMFSITPLMFEFGDNVVRRIECSTVSYFILDYLLRLLISGKKFQRGILSYFLYVISFYAIIDVLAILPVFLLVNSAFKSLRLLRLVKTLRFVKIMKYSNSVKMIINVFKKEMGLLVTVLSISLLFVFVSALMIYQFEHISQPEEFRTFFDAIWWAFATLTTVGYGDIYPISTEGRIIAILISFVGIAIVALPSGIIAAGLISEYNDFRNNKSNVEGDVNNA